MQRKADLIPGIRNAVRALIVRREKILLLKKEGGGRAQRFALPGGAQDPGESLREALNRECVEEIGTPVEIGALIHVADFFKLRDTQPPTRRHLVEFLFRCRVPDEYTPHNGEHPDKHQVEVIWADIGETAALPLFPQFLSTCIPHSDESGSSLYGGTFHDHATP